VAAIEFDAVQAVARYDVARARRRAANRVIGRGDVDAAQRIGERGGSPCISADEISLRDIARSEGDAQAAHVSADVVAGARGGAADLVARRGDVQPQQVANRGRAIDIRADVVTLDDIAGCGAAADGDAGLVAVTADEIARARRRPPDLIAGRVSDT